MAITYYTYKNYTVDRFLITKIILVVYGHYTSTQSFLTFDIKQLIIWVKVNYFGYEKYISQL